MPWGLLLNRYFLGAIALVGLLLFLAHAKHNYDDARRAEGAEPYITAIAKQKQEAQALFDAEVAKNAVISQQWAAYARKADDDYAKQITDIRAARNAANGVRLYDPGSRQGCSSSAAGKDGAGSPQDPATARPLSNELTQFLVGEATRADEVHAYAVTCYNYVKPSIREAIRGKP